MTETLHGAAVTDNYRWLEGAESTGNSQTPVSPEIAAWTDAQNSYTRAVLDNLPGRREIEDRVCDRPSRSARSRRPSCAAIGTSWRRRTGAQSQLVISWREGSLGADRVVVDPAAIDPAGLTAVTWFSPSENGKLLAFGTITAGGDGTTLRLMDVDTGKLTGLEIPNTPQGVQWLPDGSGFVYQQLKDAKDPASQQSRFHRLGTPPAADPVLSRAPFTGSRATAAGSCSAIRPVRRRTTSGWPTSPRRARAERCRSAPRRSRSASRAASPAAWLTTRCSCTRRRGRPTGASSRSSTADPGPAKWREIVPERRDAVDREPSRSREGSSPSRTG